MPDPIVRFYIKNYSSNGSVVSTETEFQQIPLTADPVILEPKVKNEMGKAGSFEFSMEMNSPYYNALLQMKTIIRITYFGHTIFRGRVLTIDKSMDRKHVVHCEGDLAFLLDSHQAGTKEESRSKIGVKAYLQQIITQHNSDESGDPDKQFTLGEVPGQYTNASASSQRVTIPSEKATQQFGDTSWNTSMDRLESLLSSFGGYFRTRYDLSNPSSPVTYLDWYDKYFNSSVNTQTIEVAKNLIDVSGQTEIANLFTIVIPIGKSDSKNVFIGDYWPVAKKNHAKVNYITVPELATIPLYSDAALNADYHRKSDYQNAITRFGKIWKTVEFENANTPEKLFKYAKDWIKNSFMPEVTQWSVTALDMKVLDSTNQVLLCGDKVNVVHPDVDQTYNGLTVISVEYDLYNPERNKYTIGVPNQEINTSYGVKNKTNTKSTSGGITKQKESHEFVVVEDDLEAMKTKLETEFQRKTNFGHDIGLDDPDAYIKYNFDGTERSAKQIESGYARQASAFANTKKKKKAELEAEAERRGVSVDDKQLLIDFTPSEKNLQTQFKNDAKYHMTHVIGISQQHAEVILNETEGQSYLASLVDDDGNWTEFAISEGVLETSDPAALKKIAIETRQMLQKGKKKSSTYGVVVDSVVGGDANIGDFLTVDIEEAYQRLMAGNLFNTESVTDLTTGLTTLGTNIFGNLFNFGSEEQENSSGTGTWFQNTFGFLGNLFTGNNTEDGKKEFNLESTVTQIFGNLANGGSVCLGNSSHNGKLSGWDVAINQPITYTAVDPDTGRTETFTVPIRSLAADDVHFTAKFDSLKTKVLVTDLEISDRAYIRDLRTAVARIDSLEADTVKTADLTTTWLNALISDISLLNVQSIASGVANSTCNLSSYYGNHFYFNIPGGGGSVSHRDVKDGVYDIILTAPKSGSNDYTLKKKNYSGTETTIGTFSRATSLSGVWSGSTYTVTATPQGETTTIGFGSSDESQLLLLTNGATSQNSTYPRKLDVPMRVATKGTSTPYTPVTRYTETITVSVPLQTLSSVTNSGTYTPSNGYVGFDSVTFDTSTARNAVKVKAFEADSRSSGLNDHRQFTYKTDAPTPVTGSSQVDTWYIARSNSTSSNQTAPWDLKAGLFYNSTSGTQYAEKSFTVNHVEIWDGSNKMSSKTISSAVTIYPWCKVDGTWVKGDGITLTPSGGGSHSIVLPGAPSTGSSEPSGTFDKSWTVSKGYTWIWMTVSCGSSSKSFKIKLV